MKVKDSPGQIQTPMLSPRHGTTDPARGIHAIWDSCDGILHEGIKIKTKY